MKRFAVILSATFLLVSAISASPLWERVLIPENYTLARASSVAADDSNNIYVTGDALFQAKNTSIITAKYSPAGDLLWTAVYDSGQAEYCHSLALDPDRNLFVVGERSTGDNSDILLIKYDSNGNLLWSRTYNGPAGKRDTAAQLIVIGSRAIIFGASLQTSDITPSKWVILSYSGEGTIEWAREFDNDGATQLHSPRGMVNDQAGNIYVTGDCRLTSLPYTHDIYTVKYSSEGTQLWVSSYDGPAGRMDVTTGISIVEDSLIVVGGTTYFANSPSQCVAVAYSATSGQQMWERVFPLDCSGINCGDEAVAITATARSNIVITASRVRPDSVAGADYDMATFACSKTGDLLWTDILHSEPDVHEWPECITVQGSGVAVAGRFMNEWSNYSCRTLIYLGDGRRLLAEDLDRPGHVNNSPIDLVVDHAGDVVIAGATAQTGESDFAMLVVKYSGACCTGQTGDVDLTGRIDLSDLSQLISFLVDGTDSFLCDGEANIDAASGVDLSDLIIFISYMTTGLPVPTDCP